MKHVCIDLDGTLLDSMGRLENIAVNVLRSTHDEATLRRRYRETSGRPFAEQAALIAPGWGLLDDAITRFEQCKDLVYETVDVFPDTRTALAQLGVNNWIVIASSTRLELIGAAVERLELEIDFIGVGGKRRAMLGADVFIGDSAFDGELAASLNLRFKRVMYPKCSLLEVARELGS